MNLPEQVKQIIDTFETNGFEAYAVGGCVRDSLLGKEPEDWDVTTDASPPQIKELFRRTVDTGIAHGTVTVLLGDQRFEVTTYRLDGEYEDNRHPREVTFTKNLKEDLCRRDFTINAMAYHPRTGLVDCLGGKEDLKKGVIRCVGDPMKRFSEDALRILRCLRFSAQLGFAVEKETKAAAKALAPTLKKISAERIQAEWTKLLLAPWTDRVAEACQWGVLEQFLPEIRVTEQLTEAIGQASPASQEKNARYLRYAMLFWGLPGQKTKEEDAKLAAAALRRMRFDNETIAAVSGLVRFRNMRVRPLETEVRQAVHETGEALFPLLLTFWKASAKAGYRKDDADFEEVEKLYKGILKRGDCLSLKSLAIDGSRLIREGIRPGKEMGRLLNLLLEQVLLDPANNTEERLLAIVRKMI